MPGTHQQHGTVPMINNGNNEQYYVLYVLAFQMA